MNPKKEDDPKYEDDPKKEYNPPKKTTLKLKQTKNEDDLKMKRIRQCVGGEDGLPYHIPAWRSEFQPVIILSYMEKRLKYYKLLKL